MLPRGYILVHASVHTPHCPIALAVSLYMLLALAVTCIPAHFRNAACSNARHSPCMLSSLCSTAHNPSTTPDRSAHNGRSAYRPSTEFASPPLSSNAAVHRRRLNTMICFCIPFCSLSLFLAVIRLFRLFLSCVLPLPFHLL